MNDRFQHFCDALAGLGAYRDGVGRVQSNGFLDCFLGAENIGRRKIDFVDDGNDLKAVVDSQVGVGKRLSFNPLAGVDHQQRALAGRQRARDLVAEIDMAGCIDQVELVSVPIVGLVHHAHGVSLDGDPTLPFEIHIVQDLGLHLAARH